MSESNTNKELALESVITSAIQIPGVKVNRNKFLAELFATEDVAIQEVLDHGPISAGISQERISAIANKHILKRTCKYRRFNKIKYRHGKLQNHTHDDRINQTLCHNKQ